MIVEVSTLLFVFYFAPLKVRSRQEAPPESFFLKQRMKKRFQILRRERGFWSAYALDQTLVCRNLRSTKAWTGGIWFDQLTVFFGNGIDYIYGNESSS